MQRWPRLKSRERFCCESLTVLLLRLRARGSRLGRRCVIHNDSYSAVAFQESLPGNATDIGFGDLIDFVHAAEQLTPIAEAELVDGKLRSQSLVIRQSTNQVRLGASLHHLQFLVADILVLQTIDLLVDGLAHLGGGWPGHGVAEKAKKPWAFGSMPTE